MSWYASCCGAAADCEEESRGGALPRLCVLFPMLCFVGTDDLSSPLCAPFPTGGSTYLPCRAGSMCPAVLLLSSRVCRGGRLCAHWLAMTDFFDSLRGGAKPRLCCFAGASSRKCNSCRNTLHETVWRCKKPGDKKCADTDKKWNLWERKAENGGGRQDEWPRGGEKNEILRI